MMPKDSAARESLGKRCINPGVGSNISSLLVDLTRG
jgi:hypothetical protein